MSNTPQKRRYRLRKTQIHHFKCVAFEILTYFHSNCPSIGANIHENALGYQAIAYPDWTNTKNLMGGLNG